MFLPPTSFSKVLKPIEYTNKDLNILSKFSGLIPFESNEFLSIPYFFRAEF